MSLSVSFNNHQNFEINQKYVDQLLTNDKDTKVKLDVMDNIKDFFTRSNKKQGNILNELHNVLHGGAEGDSLGSVSAFNRLKALADPVHQDQFHYTFDDKVYPDSGTTTKHINFMVGDEKIHSAPLRDVLFNQTMFADLAEFNEMTNDFCMSDMNVVDFEAMNPEFQEETVNLSQAEKNRARMEYWMLNSDDAKELTAFLKEIAFNEEKSIITATGELIITSIKDQSLEPITRSSIADELFNELVSTPEIRGFITDLNVAYDFFEKEQPYMEDWNHIKRSFQPEDRLKKYNEMKNPSLREEVMRQPEITYFENISRNINFL